MERLIIGGIICISIIIIEIILYCRLVIVSQKETDCKTKDHPR